MIIILNKSINSNVIEMILEKYTSLIDAISSELMFCTIFTKQDKMKPKILYSTSQSSLTYEVSRNAVPETANGSM